MTAAARAHAAEFGLDLGQRDMIAFGGAGPLHAARLGEKLGVNRILIPAGAGVGSAIGFLLATVAYEVVRSRQQKLLNLDHSLINEIMREMHDEALDVVRQGSQASEFVETRQAYMRYVGQGHEIAVDLPVENYDESHKNVFRDEFEAAYTKLYGRTIRGVEIEALSWTLTLTAPDRRLSEKIQTPGEAAAAAPVAEQSLFDPTLSRRADAPVYLRDELQPGAQIHGPALITEDQTTTVVTAAYDASIDARGAIVLTRKGATRDA